MASASPAAIAGLDLFLKSLLLAGLALVLAGFSRKHWPASRRHLLWLSSLFCLGLLPFLSLFNLPAVLPGILSFLHSRGTSGEPGFSLIILPFHESGAASSGNALLTWDGILMLAYGLPCLYLLLRLIVAAFQLAAMDRRAISVSEGPLRELAQRLGAEAGVRRRLSLKYSDEIASPVSYGLFRPAILLPRQAPQWPRAALEDLLRHELGHIRRFDWLSMLCARLIVSLYWPNPLSWIALRKLNEEAEHSCDDGVVHSGRSNTGYAENLVQIARACRSNRNQNLAAQGILGHNTLVQRIDYILEDKTMKNPADRRFTAALTLISAILVFSLGSSHFLSAQEPLERDMLPLNQVIPNYPKVAADEVGS